MLQKRDAVKRSLVLYTLLYVDIIIEEIRCKRKLCRVGVDIDQVLIDHQKEQQSEPTEKSVGHLNMNRDLIGDDMGMILLTMTQRGSATLTPVAMSYCARCTSSITPIATSDADASPAPSIVATRSEANTPSVNVSG